MNINVKVESNLDKAGIFVASMYKQMRFATANAINSTAFDARTSLSGATRQYFNNPTPFTQKGFQVEKANKTNLVGIVGAESKRGRYLRTQIKGGDRGVKPFERRFGLGRLVPAAIKLNSYGNPTKPAITKLGAAINPTGNGSVFVGTPKGGNRQPGVWQRQGRGGRDRLVPMFITATPRYQAKYPMEEIVNKVIQRRFNFYFQSSLQKAIASAR